MDLFSQSVCLRVLWVKFMGGLFGLCKATGGHQSCTHSETTNWKMHHFLAYIPCSAHQPRINFAICTMCLTPPGDRLTVLHVEGVGGESQRRAAVVALEAAAMEELPLRAQPLHHVHALPAEEANVAASDVDGELLSEGALRGGNGTESVLRKNKRKCLGEERLNHLVIFRHKYYTRPLQVGTEVITNR